MVWCCGVGQVRFTVLAPKLETIKEFIKCTVPDPTGSRNVYTMKHYFGLVTGAAACVAVGVALGKNMKA